MITRKVARLLAKELLDIQQGSAEDAKCLLDSEFTARETAMIEEEIDKIASDDLTDDEFWGTFGKGNI